LSPQHTTIYVDMDHVLCGYDEGFLRQQALHPDLQYPQSQPEMYIGLLPLPDALDTYRWLHDQSSTRVYILSAPSVMNPHSYSEKRLWVERHLGLDIADNLILSSHKGLYRGHYLIDDNIAGIL